MMRESLQHRTQYEQLSPVLEGGRVGATRRQVLGVLAGLGVLSGAGYGVYRMSPYSRTDFDRALEHHDRGDYAKAYECYLRAAKSGDRLAMYNLSVMHAKGEGRPVDYTQAFEWLRRAADAGLADAQYEVGNLYARGDYGVERDEEKAIEYWRKAARKGHQLAKSSLRLMRPGDPVDQFLGQ